MKHRKIVRLMALVALLALVGTACAKKTNTGGKKTADNIVWGTTDAETSNDPAKCYEFFCGNIIQLTYSRLVSYPAEGSALQPDAAQSLPTISPDGLTYTFKLRSGLKFSDGSVLDSSAVKYSLDRAIKLKSDASAGFLLTDVMASVDAPDASTVVIKLKHADASWLSKLSFTVASIVNPRVMSADKIAENKIIAGGGAYQMDPSKYLEGQSMQLDANANAAKKAKTKTVLIKFYKSSSALKVALQNKEVDVAFHTFLPTEISALRADSGITTTGPAVGRIRFLVFDVKQKPFDNINVRKAVAAAIDRDQLNTDAFNGTAKPLWSMLRSTFDSYKEVFKDTYGAKPDKTKVDGFLTAAGIPAGQKVDIQLWASTNHYGDAEQDAQESIRRQLVATGRFNVTSKTQDWAAYRDALAKAPAGTFGLFLLGWFPDYIDPDDYFSPFIGTEGAKSQGSFYSDPAIDQQITQEESTTDQTARDQIFKDLQQVIADKALYVPLWEEAEFVFTQKSVTGTKIDVTSFLRAEELVKSA